MAGFLRLKEDCWIVILSFLVVSFEDAAIVVELFPYLRTFLLKFRDHRTAVVSNQLSLYEPFSLTATFWADFPSHFPIFKVELNASKILNVHILSSLKKFKENEDRTDRILLHLIKHQTFKDLDEEFAKCFCPFVLEKLNDPILYAFLQMRQEGLGVQDEEKLFTSVMKRQYNLSSPTSFITEHFNQHHELLKTFAKHDPSGQLEARLVLLHYLHREGSTLLEAAAAAYVFIFGFICGVVFVWAESQGRLTFADLSRLQLISFVMAGLSVPLFMILGYLNLCLPNGIVGVVLWLEELWYRISLQLIKNKN